MISKIFLLSIVSFLKFFSYEETSTGRSDDGCSRHLHESNYFYLSNFIEMVCFSVEAYF